MNPKILTITAASGHGKSFAGLAAMTQFANDGYKVFVFGENDSNYVFDRMLCMDLDYKADVYVHGVLDDPTTIKEFKELKTTDKVAIIVDPWSLLDINGQNGWQKLVEDLIDKDIDVMFMKIISVRHSATKGFKL